MTNRIASYESLLKILRAKLNDESLRDLDALRHRKDIARTVAKIYVDNYQVMGPSIKVASAIEFGNLGLSKEDIDLVDEMMTLAAKDNNGRVLWFISQPASRLTDSTIYENLRHYIQDFGKGSFRVHFAEHVYKIKDKPEDAYKLACDLLLEDDFETVSGALQSLVKMKRKPDFTKLAPLLRHEAPIVRKNAQKLADL